MPAICPDTNAAPHYEGCWQSCMPQGLILQSVGRCFVMGGGGSSNYPPGLIVIVIVAGPGSLFWQKSGRKEPCLQAKVHEIMLWQNVNEPWSRNWALAASPADGLFKYKYMAHQHSKFWMWGEAYSHMNVTSSLPPSPIIVLHWKKGGSAQRL
jgi:hypothetical protein